VAEAVCLGELLVDFVSLTSGVRLADAVEFRRAAGGAPANVAVGLARLGVETAFIAKVGGDEFGRFLRRTIEEEGIDTSGLVSAKRAQTALAFVSLDAAGERSFEFHGEASSSLAPRDLRERPWRGARVFHYGSISLIANPSRAATLAAIARAKQRKLLVSCDPNLRLALWPSASAARAGMRLALRHADVVKISEEEVDFLGKVPRAKLVVVTRGSRGGTVYENGRRTFDFPAFRVKSIDTTGAGDAFTAGLLYGLLRDKPLRETIRIAAACGALSTLRRGAIPAMPTLAVVKRLALC
jgi:fructokinase